MILHNPQNPASLSDDYLVASLVPALIVSSVIGGATTGAGAVMQHKGANKAGELQAKAAEEALAFEKSEKAKDDQQYAEERARKWQQEDTDRGISEEERQRHHAALAPFVEFGAQGLAPLSALLRPSGDAPLSADRWRVPATRPDNRAQAQPPAAPPSQAAAPPQAAPGSTGVPGQVVTAPQAAAPAQGAVSDLLTAQGQTLPMGAPVAMPNGPPVAPVHAYRSLADLARRRRPIAATA